MFVRDCKNYFVCVIAKTVGYFMIAKKNNWTVCVCNYFACVIATRSYLWLQNLTVSVWLKSYLVIWYMIASLSSVWLQQQGRLWLQNAILCVIANTASYFMIAKKGLNQCVVATMLRCDCNQKIFVVATWLSLCGKKLLGYLVIYDCKPK
jgi:hypothetical protein